MPPSEEKAVKLWKKELAEACVQSFLGCWTLAFSSSPRKVLWQEPDMVVFSTGAQSNFQNGVLNARFTTKSKATRAKKALDYFKRRRLPMTWFVDPWSTPVGLGRFLQDQGLTPDWEIPCLAMYLKGLRRRPSPLGLEIRPVTDLKSFETCVATADRGFGGKRIENDQWREVYMGLGFGPTKRWLTGYLYGKPVASSLLLLHNGLATVWIVATRKMARGRGIGTAMTCEAMLLAKDLGYDFAVIQSSKMGLPVYKKIGFVEYSKVKTYAWKPR